MLDPKLDEKQAGFVRLSFPESFQRDFKTIH